MLFGFVYCACMQGTSGASIGSRRDGSSDDEMSAVACTCMDIVPGHILDISRKQICPRCLGQLLHDCYCDCYCCYNNHNNNNQYCHYYYNSFLLLLLKAEGNQVKQRELVRHKTSRRLA